MAMIQYCFDSLEHWRRTVDKMIDPSDFETLLSEATGRVTLACSIVLSEI